MNGGSRSTLRGRGKHAAQTGFTLIEVVMGIVVMSIALTFIAPLFFSDPGRSVRPIIEIRAAEFGQALMDEILSKKFDENTPVGGVPACTACTATMGADAGETTRADYDDVDDYNDYCNPQSLENVFGNEPDNFENFTMSVCVFYDDNYDGLENGSVRAKLISIEISPPAGANLGGPITLSAYRSNF